MKKIIFVCTGNTCRSSMAEALARDILAKIGEAEGGREANSKGREGVKGEGAAGGSSAIKSSSAAISGDAANGGKPESSHMAEGRDGTKSIGGTKGGGSPLDGGWPLGSIEVFSAGVAAFPDMPASPEAVEVMFEMGIDLEGHRASVLIPEDVESADLVLTMTERHRDFVRQMAPGAAGKVYTLGEFAGRGEDVPDPFGRSLDTYRQSAEAIKDLVIQALVRLKEG